MHVLALVTLQKFYTPPSQLDELFQLYMCKLYMHHLEAIQVHVVDHASNKFPYHLYQCLPDACMQKVLHLQMCMFFSPSVATDTKR